MSRRWREEDNLQSTIGLDEADIVEIETAADLFAAFPNDPPIRLEPTVARMPLQVAHEAPTRNAAAWDLTPVLDDVPAAAPHHPNPQRVYEEITAVRSSPKKERQWVDLHAVVDESGRLRLPEDVARQLQSGAIVEVRLASWAVPDGVK